MKWGQSKHQSTPKTTLKVINEDAEAIQASPSASMPDHMGAVEPKGMPKLEDTGPEEVLGEEPLVAIPPSDGMIDLEGAGPEEILGEEPSVAVPPAKVVLDLEGMPKLEDAGSEESMEEYLADVPPIREAPTQPWVWFKAQV